MKKLILIIAIVCSGMLIQAQTFTEVTNEILGSIRDKSVDERIKTDYGTFTFKIKVSSKKVVRIIITLSNDNQSYEEIIKSTSLSTIRVGSMWTDFIFYYEPVVTQEFVTINSARKYSLQYAQSDIKAHHQTVILKHPKNDRWTVPLNSVKEGIYNKLSNDLQQHKLYY